MQTVEEQSQVEEYTRENVDISKNTEQIYVNLSLNSKLRNSSK